MTHREPHDPLTTVLMLVLILLAFAVAGQGDYEDALAAENVALRHRLKTCQADHVGGPDKMVMTRAEVRP